MPEQLDGLSADHCRLIAAVLKRGGGSALRGWRRAFDPDGILEIKFQDFCKGVIKLKCPGDYHDLFVDDGVLTVEEFAPIEGGNLNRFRAWVKETFDGPAPMFSAFDTSCAGKLFFKDLFSACTKHGYIVGQEEFVDIFSCCDVEDNGYLTQSDVVFIETDEDIRRGEIFVNKRSEKAQTEKLMAQVFFDQNSGTFPAKHRLACRPWLVNNFERLPTVFRQKALEREKGRVTRGTRARIIFLDHLREIYGTEIRGWRRALDPEGKFIVTLTKLRRHCRLAELALDPGSLMKALDKDENGSVTLEEVCVSLAQSLCSFSIWAKGRFGTCAGLWDDPGVVRIRHAPQAMVRWASNKKMLTGSFSQTLQALDCPLASDPIVRGQIVSALDLTGCGIITREDLEWLDRWEPPEWLANSAVKAEWDKVQEIMQEKYGHPLRAWRLLLDTDNSNEVTWREFKSGCEKVKFGGNIGGAWRHLDVNLAGSITMKEYDPESSDLLESFKKWSDENFGSAALAFKALDEDGGGSISLLEFRKGCRSLHWNGDATLLFNCLDTGGMKQSDLDRSLTSPLASKRGLTLKDVSFLDSWVMGLSQEEKQAIEDETWAEVERARPLGRQKSMRKSTSSPSFHAGSSMMSTSPTGPSSAFCLGQSWPSLGPEGSLIRPVSTGTAMAIQYGGSPGRGCRQSMSQNKRRSRAGTGSYSPLKGALLAEESPTTAVSRYVGTQDVQLPALRGASGPECY